MPSSSRLLATIALTAALLSTGAPGGAAPDEPEPFDYTTLADDVSRAAFPETITEGIRLVMDDGIEIHVELSRPDPAVHPDVRVPVILSPSPYHGSLGDRSGNGLVEGPSTDDEDDPPVGLAGYFPTRGYAVGMVDLRGTGLSGGCLNHLGPRDAADLDAVMDWAAEQPWSNGRIGMIGHSYPGFATSVGVAQHHDALSTGVIIAGGASMYDHQFQHGVPYFLQWAGPQAAYPALTLARYAPGVGDPSQEYATAGCGFNDSALTAGSGQVTGQFEQWHVDRDFRDAALAADIPLLVNHGVTDHQIRTPAMEWFFTERLARDGDKVWIGPWGHEAGNLARPVQWRYLLHAWFDRHLLGREIDTGPAVEAFFDDGDAVADHAWTAPSSPVALHLDASDMSLGWEPPSSDASAAFTATGNVDAAYQGKDDGGVEFVMPSVGQDMVLLGVPELTLRASVTSEAVHLVAILYRVQNRRQELLGTCAIQPQLREDVRTVTPVVPGEVMDLPLQCFLLAHRLEADDQLVLRVGTGSHHHFTPLSADARITVHTGAEASVMELPHRPDAVPLPAPAPDDED